MKVNVIVLGFFLVGVVLLLFAVVLLNATQRTFDCSFVATERCVVEHEQVYEQDRTQDAITGSAYLISSVLLLSMAFLLSAMANNQASTTKAIKQGLAYQVKKLREE